MIKDERIRKTKNRIASRGFGIWYFLLLVALLYRQFYLGQSLGEYWDIALIFFMGTSYVALAGFAKGAVHEQSLAKYWKWTLPIIMLTIVGLSYIQDRINTIVDLLTTLVFSGIGASIAGWAFYILYRRWERAAGLEE